MSSMKNEYRIGFVQGRLSPLVDGRIQAFPWEHWKNEFVLAQQYHFPLLEWTLDLDLLEHNPLMTREGREDIIELCLAHAVKIQSVTCDFIMQEPFYKYEGKRRAELLRNIEEVLLAMGMLKIPYMVVPLVDNGSIDNPKQEFVLREGLKKLYDVLLTNNVMMLFESDFSPKTLRQFIEVFDGKLFGINYDIGNSASLGFEPREEISAYGRWIKNVHVKDRNLGGGTVPLGEGNANLKLVCKLLHDNAYKGGFILQTARASDERHVDTLCGYRDVLLNLLRNGR